MSNLQTGPVIPEDICAYLRDLLSACPEIESFWLFGSRANPTVNPPRDWDFLVFGSIEILATLQGIDTLQRPDVDIFIVFDGNRFEGPWPIDGELKTGRLRTSIELEEMRKVYGYDWHNISDTEASYTSTRHFRQRGFRAFRVYPP